MALVSLRNIVHPLTNTVHLATVAFIVLLFATFRLAGGAFSTNTVGGGEVRDRGALTRPQERIVSGETPQQAERARGISSSRAPVAADSNEDILGSIMKEQPRKQEVVPKQPDGDFEEIERRLGLR